MNCTDIGNKNGKFILMGARGSTVIDYIVVNENCMEIVNSFKVIGRVESDYIPLSLVTVEEEGEQNKWREEEQGEEAVVRI